MSEPLLRLDGARAGYGPNDVLGGVSLSVGKTEIVTLLGGNGAGKTTTLSVLSGILPLRSGRVLWDGRDVTTLPPAERLRAGLVLCPEGRRIFGRLTVEENLVAGAWVRDPRRTPDKLELAYTRFPVLRDRRRQLGGTLSGGEQQMLAIARALMSEPGLLMLDEPSLGLAPLVVERIFAILVEINASGIPVLLVEQNARQALRVAHRAYVLATGEIVREGTGAELLASDEVRRVYLGEE
ncbi:MAG TPA: ABC transporter ATP-binding protein [Fibrobacteria bacterium]|nr:ABC transporter ATP-binding protein [Fibrobacteria bacterium]